jgi:colanic acid/amylovoran biosynthesis glycosyltransferase
MSVLTQPARSSRPGAEGIVGRVAYVLERYPELSQTFVEDELGALAHAGAEPVVLALQPGAFPRLTEARFRASYPAPPARRLGALAALVARRPGVTIEFLRHRGRWPRDGRRLRGLARVAAWVRAARTAVHLHAHFATEAADIAGLLGRLSGRTHSFTGHSTDLFADPAGLRLRLRKAAFAVVVCEYDLREIERLAPGEGRIEVIPLGLDLERLRRRTPYDPDGPVVAVGRLVGQKGFADLVAVASDLGRDVVIAGDGPLRDELGRRAGDSVRFFGALTRAKALELIERAGVLVMPSVIAPDGSRDGIPMVLKEALALSVPVVASDAVGNPEVVEPAWGALFPAGDRRKLAEAVRGVLARPSGEREAMGRAGRGFAERTADVRQQTGRLAALFAAAAARGVGTSR